MKEPLAALIADVEARCAMLSKSGFAHLPDEYRRLLTAVRELARDLEKERKEREKAEKHSNIAGELLAKSHNAIRNLRAVLKEFDTKYTDNELGQLAACLTGMGKISPETASRCLRLRKVMKETNGHD